MKSFCNIFGHFYPIQKRIGEVLEHLFELNAVCDAAIQFDQLHSHRDALVELQRRGGLIVPEVFPNQLDSAIHHTNWWKLSQADSERLLRVAQERYATFDVGPLVAINTYTAGNEFVAACRKLGIRYILGCCAPTIAQDGGWEIAQYGSPLSPYFISDEDFRKPENASARPDPVIWGNMELRNPVTCFLNWVEGPFCPLNAQAVDRWLEPTSTPYPFLAMAEDWLWQAEMTGTPRFFYINLQYFYAGACYEHNRVALEWLAEQRDRGRLEFVSAKDWQEQMRAAGGLPRQTSYWRGEMMGFHVGHRLGSVADVIVDESLERQTIWQSPKPLPWRSYDYTKRWKYPAFQPDGSAPASEEYPNIDLKTKLVATQGTTRIVEVVIANNAAARRVPLALWNLLEDCVGPFSVEAPTGWQASVLPHPAGTTGAVLLDGIVPAGQTRFELRLKFGSPRANRHIRRWGRLLEAQTFEFRGEPYTVLVTQAPERFVVTARAKRAACVADDCGRSRHDEPIRVESLCGVEFEERTLPANGLPLSFDGSRLAGWHRFWGIRADELEIEGVEEAEARLQRQTAELVRKHLPGVEVDGPGYQLFEGVFDKNAWERRLPRAVGEAELASMSDWFRKQRPAAGEVVVEVHPGIYLPRGSMQRVTSHEFTVVRCAPGYGFAEENADYAQGWDWGVAAWVQWRWLVLRLDGLQGKTGEHTLHLHGFDPESRDISQRVHFINPDPTAEGQLCVSATWALPKGIEGRWDSSALCSMRIPKECYGWNAIKIWINPLEKMQMHNWVAEKGAPGLVSHLWVTRR